jgi:argininosuccinate lyase
MVAKKPWSGRFVRETDTVVEEFTASISIDHVLYKYDIMGSIAHCRMLSKQKIIPGKEAKTIIRALKEIEKEIECSELLLGPEFEDIHMLIESRLIEKVGPFGGKLHTARSRNDQIALDMSLYLRDAVVDIICLIDRVQHKLLDMAEKHIDVFMPGFTHLQHAQPVLLSHHLMAYFEMLQRDRCRMQSCHERINRMPLGAGALAGTPHPVDRQYVASILGYPTVTVNSMDSVSDRDSLIEFCSNSAIIMMHLSRSCEELILWSSSEFQFVEISDSFCTGSSIMPQKKNPDVPELVRGKTGRVYGNLMSLLTLMKALPLAYNRDLQEDKTALFDTVETTKNCLNIFSLMLPEIKVNKQKMAEAAQRGFLTATDLADYLAGRGVPFRTAHEVVGRIVSYCVREKKTFRDLSFNELKRFSTDFKRDALNCLTIESSVNSRKCIGGTGKQAVKRAITKAKTELRKGEKFIEKNKFRN